MKVLLGLGAALTSGPLPVLFGAESIRKRPIPRTGERIPVVGLGTARRFNVGSDAVARAPVKEVLRGFFELGGRLVDTSPTYGAAEQVSFFLATKVSIRGGGREKGIEQMERSMQLLRTKRVDLMQVHNLRDWKTQLKTLREWKEAGKIRYLGVTTSNPGVYGELESIVKNEKLDFVQLKYSIVTRVAEERLLPVAADTGTAVVINRAFERGAVFRVKGNPLPLWASEFDCKSWAQFFLKFVISHPAVNCPIPATRKPKHLVDNMGAGFGRLPDAKMRRRMWEHMESL
jgi:diketogulonate reductase-like aldo/keto reductase